VVSATAIRLFRLVMLLYPREFRRRYGDQMVQVMIDQHCHQARRTSGVLLHETFDAVRAAPRMRWESPMKRTVILVVAVTVAIAAAVVAKMVLVPLGLVAVGGWFLWGRPAQPIASATLSRRWMRWLIAGALAVGAAVAIPAIDGGELNELWWTVMAVALLGGIGLVVTGVVLAANNRAHRVAPKH
jgi:hypothetical protein